MSDLFDDKALIEAAIAGDGAALEQLLWAYYGTLERYIGPKIPDAARKHFAVEDILQTAFAQAFRDIHRFEPRGDGSFLAWLRAIADHRLIDGLRKVDRGGRGHQISNANYGDATSMVQLIDQICHHGDSPSKAAAGKEVIQAMQVAIAGLPDDQQEVIRLHFLEHKSIEEVAVQTGRTNAAVRGLIFRGKKNLGDAMGRSSRWLSSR